MVTRYTAKNTVISSNFMVIEITLRHGCSPLNLLHIFGTPFYKNTYGGLHLDMEGLTKSETPKCVFN